MDEDYALCGLCGDKIPRNRAICDNCNLVLELTDLVPEEEISFELIDALRTKEEKDEIERTARSEWTEGKRGIYCFNCCFFDRDIKICRPCKKEKSNFDYCLKFERRAKAPKLEKLWNI